MSSGGPLDVAVPGDKSLSHRALIFASLANGTSQVNDILDSADVHSTAECLRLLGVAVPPIGPRMSITGVGVRGLVDPKRDLDCGNSGTTARLMAGLVAGAGRTARFVGDASLSRRPMQRVAEPLRSMGASVSFENGDGLPMRIAGSVLHAVDHVSAKSSAQLKGAVLLAAFASGAAVRFSEPIASRDHTERMLAALGVPVRTDGTTVALDAGAPPPNAFEFDVPGDPSSAAFFAAWAVLAGLALRTNPVSVNPTRTGFFDALARMGADITTSPESARCGEPVGRIVVRGGVTRALTLDPQYVPGMIDELPLLACIGAYAPGETRVRGAAELRVKESDRIATVVSNLNAIGADAEELADGFAVRGGGGPLRGRVVTHGDHRIAMAFGVLGALPGNAIEVDDPDCVAVSFPAFWTELNRLATGVRAA